VRKMAAKRFTKMAYSSADEMTFGVAKFPVKAGLGLEIGAGYTIQRETRERIREDHH
jgi:methanol---5-hydroxybenzimidazolylcobamide Co-methyltransferase